MNRPSTAGWLVGAVLILTLAWLLPGCGGLGGGSAPHTGTLVLRVVWPAASATNDRLIPAASKAIKFEIYRAGAATPEKVAIVARPNNQVTLTDVLAGSVTLKATAYPNADATGTPQASAEKPITVVAGQTTTESITLATTIDRIEVAPTNPFVTIGQWVQLVATAKNASGNTVLIAPGNLEWVSSDTSVATVDATGKVTGVVAGSADITVTENESGKSVTVAVSVGSPPSRKWTFLVFLNADNDLNQFGYEDVNEMEMVGSSAEVDIIVQMDTLDGPCRRIHVVRDSEPTTITSPVLQEMGEVDMGNWRVLRDFVQWGVTNYPAEHYAIVLWDHGAGWRSATTETRNPLTRGVSFDDTSGNHISITDLPQALDVQPRLDIVCFDASLMQMVEVAYELRHFGRIMVGSEESPPGPGYPYQTFLASLVAAPTMLPEQFAERIVTQTLQFYASIGFPGGLTQSAVSLAEMDSLASALDGFARALATAMPTFSTQIASARDQAQRYAYPDNKDLYDFALLIHAAVPRDNVTAATQAVMQSVEDAVLAEAHNAARANSHGLGVFVPTRTNYSSLYAPTYQQLELSANTFWDDWLSISPP